ASGVAPAVLPGIGRALRLGARGALRIPGVREAAGILRLEAIRDKSIVLGAEILKKAKGIIAKPARVLFRAIRRQQVQIGADDLPRTLQALDAIEKELTPFAAQEQAAPLLGLITGMKTEMAKGDITFEMISRFRTLIGRQIGKFEAAGGFRLDGAKRLFKGLIRDIDDLPIRLQGKVRGGRALTGDELTRAQKLFSAAPERAKLEFAVNDLNELIAKHTKINPGQTEATINVTRILDTLKALTNPNSSQFDKNFSSAFKNEIPDMIKFFANANKELGARARGGELVVRGAAARASRALLGAATGGLIGGAGAALGGGIIGAQAPELITAALLSQRGRLLMTQLIRAGKGELNDRALATIGQFLARSTGETGREVAKDFFLQQRERVKEFKAEIEPTFKGQAIPR
ncbi:hypothetical protein LCGC14_2390240, partial [marine sediment metagenome]